MANFIDIELGADPLLAGSDIALNLTPILIEAVKQGGYESPEQSLHFWSGFFSAMTGTLTAALGPKSAKAILEYLQNEVIPSVEHETGNTGVKH